MPDSKVEPFERPEVPSNNSLEMWHRVVKDPLFLRVLQGYRFEVVQRLLGVVSDSDAVAKISYIRGQKEMIDLLTSGALDKYASSVLGLPSESSVPPITPYMPFDTDQQEKQ